MSEGGIMSGGRKGKINKPTQKILIVGPSGSGKTSLACNLIFRDIKPFCGIIFIAPKISHDDSAIETLKHYCDKAMLPVYIQEIDDNIPEIEGGSVLVIDDYYSSTARNGKVEKLLKDTVNTGRHNGIHVIYCAQLAHNLPSEIKVNNTDIYLNSEYASDDKIYEKINKKIPNELPDFKRAGEHIWYKYDPIELERVSFKKIPTSNIKQYLEYKIPKQMRDKVKKIYKDTLKNLIEAVPQGNVAAATELVAIAPPVSGPRALAAPQKITIDAKTLFRDEYI